MVGQLRLSHPHKNPYAPFPESVNGSKLPSEVTPGAQKMSRFFFAVFIAASLVLTAYFGAAAWRASEEGRADITGQIRPAIQGDDFGQH